MERALKQEAGRIAPQDCETETVGLEREIANLRDEVADLKANGPTGPSPFDAPVLISLNDVCKLTTLSRTAVNRWRTLGLFPAAVPLGDKRVAFVKAEVEAWVRDRVTERDRRKAAEAHAAASQRTGES
ncbi:AlpA family phage regulatory protein [Sinorhizobium meliloti]|nr:AlpA family phage regulatory protein [Sinorhizobium meliloti]MDX0212051.1 AlpA family phage regulatory protein [Sinorhizobium meliloti]